MVTAFVLMNVSAGRAADLADELLALEGVREIHVVAGEYDMVAVLRVETNAELSAIITRNILLTPGVDRTKTLFALDSRAEVDLAKVFGLV